MQPRHLRHKLQEASPKDNLVTTAAGADVDDEEGLLLEDVHREPELPEQISLFHLLGGPETLAIPRLRGPADRQTLCVKGFGARGACVLERQCSENAVF